MYIIIFRRRKLIWRANTLLVSVLAAISGLYSARSAYAFDLEALSRLLLPADLALMVTNACVATDPTFSNDLGGRYGTVPEYAQRVKDAVSDSLTPDQVQTVLRRAADAARAEALRAIRTIAVPNEVDEQARMQEWCATKVKPFAQNFVRNYDERLEEFTQKLIQAKSK
jgi:hypothetical protein